MSALEGTLVAQVSRILAQNRQWRNGVSVPDVENVALAGGGVRLKATVLYADLAQSSQLATDFQQRTSAKVIRCFLYCMCNLVTAQGGVITSFDGDRVMGVFVGKNKNTNAVVCALKMNCAVSRIIRPKLLNHFSSLEQAAFPIEHCVGVDTGDVLAIRAGQRGSNNLVWVGRAPNLAAKLSEVRVNPYCTFISKDVFDQLNDSAKYGGNPKQIMWELRWFQFVGDSIPVYCSEYVWIP